MKKTLLIFITSAFLLGSLVFLPSCDPDNPWFDPLDSITPLENLGWNEEDEDLESIEDDFDLSAFSNTVIDGYADLSAYFPPIGDQGSYGTCVAWALGYNHKSYMQAIDDKRTSFNSSTMFSPKYLFWAVPGASKGDDCNGTGFEPAYDIMISKGIANMSTVPYESLGDCSGSTSSWDGAAAAYKIENYREIDVVKNDIKRYLEQGRPVAIGAKLGDNFMAWNSSSVLSSETYGYSGQHAYHAMIVCGYDDSKGTNGAFRVVNSWGTTWGDNGYIWVDCNFFVNEFCFCAFVAKNFQVEPDGNDDDVVDDPNSGFDLMAWELADEDNENSGVALDRKVLYNMYNSGSLNIVRETDWNILYIYYNAYNANDYGIILFDYYSNDYGIEGQNGDLDVTDPGFGDGLVDNWWNNVDVPAGQSVAYAVYGDDPTSDRFRWDYTMPAISGEYYLVMIADGYDVISEYDESNNYFYITDTQGGPITFSSGIMQETPYDPYSKTKNLNPNIGDDSPLQTVINERNLNAYSTQEIKLLINDRLKSGEIKAKALEFLKSNKNTFKKTKG